MMNQSILPEEVQKEEPKETYCVTVTVDEVKKIGKHLNQSIIIVAVLQLVCVIYCLGGYLSNKEENEGILFVAGFFLAFAFIFALVARSTYKSWNGNAERVASTTFHHAFYDTYLVITQYAEGEMRSFAKIEIKDIQKVQYIQNYVLMTISGKIFIFRKTELKPDSVLHTLMQRRAKGKSRPRPTGLWRVISITLFVATLLSLHGGLAITMLLAGNDPIFVYYTYSLYFLLPIPIASVIVGYILKKKGYKYKKNVISGIIMAILLCIYGSFGFLF